VLIAEDEAITALALAQTLIAYGYEISGPAASGAEARLIAEADRPMLAIIDMRLKDGLTGHVAARDIQDRLGIPVILMSGHADARMAADLKAAGFLAKPFAESELLTMIERALSPETAEAAELQEAGSKA
jgi:DNA-binding NtrC family response regulator